MQLFEMAGSALVLAVLALVVVQWAVLLVGVVAALLASLWRDRAGASTSPQLGGVFRPEDVREIERAWMSVEAEVAASRLAADGR
ncbi:MAG: hypothetical protein ACYCUF_12240 [Acidimicrobiales bacterium]|jgi:hypothetical protein|nr:hypothetical protein [Actinomycetota bacterium]